MSIFKKWVNPYRGNLLNSVVLQYAQLHHGHVEYIGYIPLQPGNKEVSGLQLQSPDTNAFPISFPENPATFLLSGKKTHGYRFHLILDENIPPGDYAFHLLTQDGDSMALPIATGPRFPLCPRLYRHQALISPDGKESYIHGNILSVRATSLMRRVLREVFFYFELVSHWTYPELLAVPIRFVFHIWRFFNKKRIWIFSDKLTNPIDNAYSVALSLLASSTFKQEQITPFYLIDGKHSLRVKIPEGLRLIRYLTIRHVLIHLAAEVNVTSEGGYVPLLPILPYGDIVAWQLKTLTAHGVIHHDLSALYGRDFNAFNLVLASVKREEEYMRGGLWDYAEDEVVLTGLPRWDARESAPENKIYFVFTWRNSLVDGMNPITKERCYSRRFYESDYCERIKSIVSNEHLKELAGKHGYRLCFLPHPLVRSAIDAFKVPAYMQIVDADTPYETIYKDASMIVTDYSSVAMDMAYLGKPVVYYQFDREEFYKTQGYTQSFYSWEEDGFGPVVFDEERAIAEIEQILQNQCVPSPKYRQRALAFFPPIDKENGRRACKVILARLAFCNKPH